MQTVRCKGRRLTLIYKNPARRDKIGISVLGIWKAGIYKGISLMERTPLFCLLPSDLWHLEQKQ